MTIVKCPICGREGELKVVKVGYLKCYIVDHGDIKHEIECIQEFE